MMPLTRSAELYFQLVSEFQRADRTHQGLMLRGTIALACRTMEEPMLRRKLQQYWEKEATRLGIDFDKWKSWP